MTPMNGFVNDLLPKDAALASIPIAVASTGVAYSNAFALPAGAIGICFEYQASSDGVVAVKAELEQSFSMPETEGAADANFVVPDGAVELNNNLGDENVHIKSYPPSATPYGRLKFTGLTGNDASTKISRLKMGYIQ